MSASLGIFRAPTGLQKPNSSTSQHAAAFLDFSAFIELEGFSEFLLHRRNLRIDKIMDVERRVIQ
jgi:hypothetical protein